MFLAACEGIKRGLSDFLLLGGTGGRLDHTLANLALLCELAETGVTATMVDGQNSVRLLLPGEYVLCGDGYEKISIFSYTERCTGVCFSGVEYPLEQATLTNTFPLGVSNEQVGDVSLSFSSGRLVLVFSKD